MPATFDTLSTFTSSPRARSRLMALYAFSIVFLLAICHLQHERFGAVSVDLREAVKRRTNLELGACALIVAYIRMDRQFLVKLNDALKIRRMLFKECRVSARQRITGSNVRHWA